MNWLKIQFSQRNVRGLLGFATQKDATPANFMEKTFAYSHKTLKFAKLFSLESFPLYSIDREEKLETLFNTKQNKCTTHTKH